MIFLNSTPFIYFFLSFLQFFTLSSLYIFINLSIPADLYNSLKSTYSSMNSNLFNLVGIDISVPAVGIDRVEEGCRASQMQLSTLFLDSNYQYLLLLAITFGILFISHKILPFCKANPILYKIFNLNKQAVILGFLVSGMISFILPIKFILTELSSSESADKTNNFIQIIVFGLVISYPGLYFCILVLEAKCKEKLKNKEKKAKNNKALKNEAKFHLNHS